MIVPPRTLDKSFVEFLKERGQTLDSIRLVDLFDAFVIFFDTVRIEQCKMIGNEDFLQCEVFEGTICFARLIDVPMELMYNQDEDWIEDNRGYRELWGMMVSPSLSVEPFVELADGFNTVFNSHSAEYPDTAAFSQAVRSHPVMRWAASQTALPAELNMEQVG